MAARDSNIHGAELHPIRKIKTCRPIQHLAPLSKDSEPQSRPMVGQTSAILAPIFITNEFPIFCNTETEHRHPGRKGYRRTASTAPDEASKKGGIEGSTKPISVCSQRKVCEVG